ncbi:hypothetical protein N431DRAFT_435283, partial [Stipitochalara longipes BDJ]
MYSTGFARRTPKCFAGSSLEPRASRGPRASLCEFPFAGTQRQGVEETKNPRTTKITASHHRQALDVVPTVLLWHPAVPRTNIPIAQGPIYPSSRRPRTHRPCHPAQPRPAQPSKLKSGPTPLGSSPLSHPHRKFSNSQINNKQNGAP